MFLPLHKVCGLSFEWCLMIGHQSLLHHTLILSKSCSHNDYDLCVIVLKNFGSFCADPANHLLKVFVTPLHLTLEGEIYQPVYKRRATSIKRNIGNPTITTHTSEAFNSLQSFKAIILCNNHAWSYLQVVPGLTITVRRYIAMHIFT